MSQSELQPGPLPKQVEFTLLAQDPDAELSVVDSSLATVAQAIGHLGGALPQGIYKARASLGQQIQEQYLVLADEQSPATVMFPRFVLRSPAPFDDAWKANEVHRKAAEQLSLAHHAERGRGSEIFVFVRDEGPARLAVRSGQRRLAAGLALSDSRGERLIEFTEVGSEDAGAGSNGPFYACNAQVSPGVYYLSLRTEAATLVRAVSVPRGYQLQIFSFATRCRAAQRAVSESRQRHDVFGAHRKRLPCSVPAAPLARDRSS